MKTQIINLWGGPGSGKSTMAAELFARLKRANVRCELVTEYVKAWAWRGEKIGLWDDIYITAKQLRRESACYGRVDYIITDSPLGLGAIYERLYNPESFTVSELCESLFERQLAQGLVVRDFLVERLKPFHQAGRYETEDQARAVDALCVNFLQRRGPVCKVHNTEGLLAQLELP